MQNDHEKGDHCAFTHMMRQRGKIGLVWYFTSCVYPGLHVHSPLGEVIPFSGSNSSRLILVVQQQLIAKDPASALCKQHTRRCLYSQMSNNAGGDRYGL